MRITMRELFALSFLLSFWPNRVEAQVLNMSHDLTTLGIATQNMVPDSPSLDSRPLFQATLQYAQSHPLQTITLDKGSYYLLTPQQSNEVLEFPSLSSVVVDLAGSTFYFNGPLLSNGFVVNLCTNFTLKNFQTDYIQPPYTHVSITSVDTTNRLIHYQTLPGWPDPSTFNNLTGPFGGGVQFYGAIFRNGKPVFGTTRTAITLPMGNNTLTLTQDNTPWTQSATLGTLQPGDTVVVTARAGGPLVLIQRGDAVTLSNVTIYGANQFAVFLFEIGNSIVDNVRVMPRPGIGLIGSNADGIHIGSSYQNNHISHSYVTRTLDDGIIIDSQIQATVVSSSGPRQITVKRYNLNNFPNGTAANFVDPLTTVEFTGGIIVSQTPPDSVTPGSQEQVALTFDRDLPALSAGQFMVYGSPALRGQGSSIEDNTVEDIIAGRGIWVTGLNGAVVQRNVVRRTSEGGIVLAQDTEAYPSPPVQNITVTDNILENAPGNQAAGTGIKDTMGGIELITTNNQSFGFATAAPNTNVSIVNNYIADADRSGIWIGELNGGLLQNNLIVRPNQQPTLGGTFGISPQFQPQVMTDALTPLVMRYSSNVAITNNTIATSSPIAAPVVVSPRSAAIPAQGGSGIFMVSPAISGFAWNAISNDSWITITAGAGGSGNGMTNYSVAANTGTGPRTGSITVAGVTFVVNQSSTVPSSPANGALAHFAAGGTWTTGIFVVNNGAQPAHFSIAFLGDNGNPVALPFSSGSTSTLSGTVPGNGSAYYEAGNSQIALSAGWGQITADPSIIVQALFRNNANGTYYEAAVPSSAGSREFLIPFDATTFAANGAPFYTGFAVANLDQAAGNVTCLARDSSGNVIPSAIPSFRLNSLGHWANYLFPALAGMRGTIDCIADANIAATAFRFIGSNAFSSLPVVTSFDSSASTAAAIAHFAAGSTWTTGFFVINTGAQPAHFSIAFYDDNGNPAALPFMGSQANTLSGTIPANGSAYFEASNPQVPLAAGWGKITADPSIVVQALFRNNANGTYYEAAVPSSAGRVRSS